MLNKNSLKKYILSLVIVCFVVMCFPTSINAATVALSASNSLEVGATTTLNISIAGVTGRCNIASSNPGAVSISASSIWVEKGAGEAITLTAKSAGSSTITVTPQTLADDTTGDDVTVASNSITVTVIEKEVVVTQPETNTNQNTTNNVNTNTNKNTNTNTNTSTKSSNNYLSSLQVNQEGLTPNFVKTKLNYSLSVGDGVTSLEVNATPESSKSTVYVSGNEELKDGDNNVYITVVAQNGEKRTYTIVVNKTSDPVKSNSYLANLIIKDMVFTPEFSKEVLEYDGGTIQTNDTKLDIYAFPENDRAKVEITGNENLVNGENTITIKVTSENETTTKEYVIRFIKEEKLVEDIVETNPYTTIVKEDDSVVAFFKSLWNAIQANSLLVLMYIVVVVEFIQILYLYFKLKKKDEKINNFEKEEEIVLGRDLVEKEIKEELDEPLTLDEIVNDENSNNEFRKRKGLENLKSQDEVKDLTEETKDIEEDIYTSIDKELEDINQKLDSSVLDDEKSEETQEKEELKREEVYESEVQELENNDVEETLNDEIDDNNGEDSNDDDIKIW